MEKKLMILPSLLAADYGCLAKEIRRAASAGADALHIDIMDPHFVPNISFGPDIVSLVRRVEPTLYRHVHLMMSRPDLYLQRFAEAGAQTIQVHVEADCDIHNALRHIRELGAKPAIVLNPETPVERILPYLSEADEVLVMTVHPGYGGQKFMGECLEKTRYLRKIAPHLDIMVDGGVNGETAVKAVENGVNMLVSGSFLFAKEDMRKAVEALRNRLETVKREGEKA